MESLAQPCQADIDIACRPWLSASNKVISTPWVERLDSTRQSLCTYRHLAGKNLLIFEFGMTGEPFESGLFYRLVERFGKDFYRVLP